jgi:hypothetical protein
MKKFFLKTLFFIVPLILLLFYVDNGLNEVINSFNYKKTCLEHRLDSIEILVTGSSQAAYGINPDFFDKEVFNLSTPSQSLFYDTRLVLKYVDRMPALKYVIINVSYFSFDYQVLDGTEKWRDFYYSQFWNVKYPEVNSLDIRNYSKIALYGPDSSFLYWMHGFNVNLANQLSKNGYLRMDTLNNSLSINDTLGYRRVKAHDYNNSERNFEENSRTLKVLIKTLKKKSIIPVIVTPPVFLTYSKFINRERWERTKRKINEICSSERIRYYDYFTDSRFIKQDFLDNDHLNFVGAKKFSTILNKEVLH